MCAVVGYEIMGRDGQDNPIRGAARTRTVIGVFPNGRILVQISPGDGGTPTTETWDKDNDWNIAA